MRAGRAAVTLLLACGVLLGADSCGPGRGAGRKKGPRKLTPLVFKQHSPNEVENSLAASGPPEGAIGRNSSRFKDLVLNYNRDIIFKDEEGSGADRVMTQRCQEKLNTLAILVMNQWPGIRLRVTEGWDEQNHHSANSLHYEGRAVDITTSDKDRAKYGMLARLAKEAGFDWVYYESRNHIHCSVKSEPSHGKYGGCFSADGTVTTSSGETKRLEELRVGDRVLTMDLGTGEAVFSEVLLFLDRDPADARAFVRLHLESGGTLTVTPSHLLISADAGNGTRTEFAADVRAGDAVLVHRKRGGAVTRDRVLRVTTSFETGVYAPLTGTGTVIVNNVVASCYATIDSQTIAHYAMAPVRIAHKLAEGFRRVRNLLGRKTGRGGDAPEGTPGVGVYWYAQVLYAIADCVVPSRMYK